MQETSINRVKYGQQLAEEVRTSLGGILFYKGHELLEKDIDTLRAFLIENVVIDSATIAQQNETKQEVRVKQASVTSKQDQLEEEYYKVVKETEKLLANLQGLMNPPVLEIRECLIPFIKRVVDQPSFILHLIKLSTTTKSYQAHHPVAVSIISSFLALKSGIQLKEIPQVSLAGYLHNIGQLKVDQDILNKNVALNQQEFKEIQQHPIYGYEILKKTPGLSEGVIKASLQHHEREDGSGYPLGTKSNQIHPYAKIIAISDVYYAMCTERPYKKALSPFLVLDQLKSDSYGKLDTTYVYFFVELITSLISVGTKVLLSNGYIGEVVYIDKNSPTRPMINCNGELVNLQQSKEIYIDQLDI
jgi:HD-GYP domain-containing protein (c-di-GMP phosphodiesterase class II)